jgi:hypothetical protein
MILAREFLAWNFSKSGATSHPMRQDDGRTDTTSPAFQFQN